MYIKRRTERLAVTNTALAQFQMFLTLNLPTTNIIAQPFNIIKWQLKFNPVA